MFKLNIIKLIPKGVIRANAKNYRTDSLTSHVIHVLEHIVKKKLIAFFENNVLHPDTQLVIHSGRGCLTQLLQNYDWVLRQLKNCTVKETTLQMPLIRLIRGLHGTNYSGSAQQGTSDSSCMIS